jgi:hypothetical protein
MVWSTKYVFLSIDISHFMILRVSDFESFREICSFLEGPNFKFYSGHGK